MMPRHIIVDLTVPILVGEPKFAVGEFDIWVDVPVTSFGYSGTYLTPPEPAEWDGIENMRLYGPKNEDGIRPDMELPDELRPHVDAYLESEEGIQAICDAIDDADRYPEDD